MRFKIARGRAKPKTRITAHSDTYIKKNETQTETELLENTKH